MKKILMIDDQKSPNHIDKDKWADKFEDKYYTEEEVNVVRTYQEGIEELKKGRYSTLLLDHDLGTGLGKQTGYDILMWLEKNPVFMPSKIILITANPGVIGKMIALLINFEENRLIDEWDRVSI
jgi:hypothetical protein